MITVKLYRDGKTRIYEAGSVTILRSVGVFSDSEITLHGIPGHDDLRVDVTQREENPESPVTHWDCAVIENANGKTSEIIRTHPYGIVGAIGDQFPLKAT
jgi:hypothetical protein